MVRTWFSFGSGISGNDAGFGMSEFQSNGGSTMRRYAAAGIAVLGLILALTTVADAQRGGFRGGGFRGGFGGFRGGAFIGPRFGFGLGIYDPFWWPGYYPWGYPWAYPYYPAPGVVQYAPPPGYAVPPGAPPQQQFWYRCGNPEGYFPYVQNCMTGWEQVPVTPNGAPPGGLPPAQR